MLRLQIDISSCTNLTSKGGGGVDTEAMTRIMYIET